MHEIDLSSFSFRTDLAVDHFDSSNSSNYSKKIVSKDIYIEEINIDSSELSNYYKKKIGLYNTICFKDITDKDNFNKVLNTFVSSLSEMLESNNIKDSDTVLVIGLGNKKSTPDALGSKTISHVIATRHLFSLGEVEEGYRNVSILEPGVTGVTGIETKDIVLSIVDTIKPDFVIIIDALATTSIDRLNKTIQISNSGITPGSGVNNSRISIDKETLGIPVIVIGVPTIIDSSVLVANTIKYMMKKFSYDKNNINNKIDKLKYKIDYKDYDKDLDNKDKEMLFGIVGTLSEDKLIKLTCEVLNPIDYNFMVTPKEIDFLIDKLSLLLGKGINKALHNKTIYD